jgi:hypothetical protein
MPAQRVDDAQAIAFAKVLERAHRSRHIDVLSEQIEMRAF